MFVFYKIKKKLKELKNNNERLKNPWIDTWHVWCWRQFNGNNQIGPF